MTVMPSVDRQRGTLIGPARGDAIGVAVAVEGTGMRPGSPSREGRHGRRLAKSDAPHRRLADSLALDARWPRRWR